MEGLAGLSQWKAIATADFYASTSRFRGRRRKSFLLFLIIVLIWAFLIAPLFFRLIIEMYPDIESLLQVYSIGLLRSIMFFIWILILMYPAGSALQEYKFRDWELILSCDVDTKQILIGKFMGRLPKFSLLSIALSALLVSIYDSVFHISVFGQILIYAEVMGFLYITLGISLIIWSGIQARLNQSPRGDFLARIISGLMIFIVLIPMFGLQMFSEQFTAFMENVPLQVLPSTWSSDLTAWIILVYGTEQMPISLLLLYPEILVALLGCYAFVFLLLGFLSADRVFTIALGARLESHRTMGKENFFLRFVRRIWPGYWGTLVATSFKHIYRKPENTGKIVYAGAYSILPALIFPIAASFAPTEPPPDFILLLSLLLMIIAFPLVGATMFGGIGFFENKYQLWVIQDAPDGVKLFTTGRLAAYAVSAAFLAAVPAVGIGIIYSSQPLVAVILYGCAFMLTMAGTLQGMGIASINPAYEDELSPPLNILVTTVTAWGLPFVLLFVGLPSISPIINTYFSGAIALLLSLVLSIILPMMLIGLVLFYIGMKNLMRTSK